MNPRYGSTDDADDALEAMNAVQKDKVDQERARARKWTAEASLRELELSIKRGDLLSRTANRDAAVVILATLAQTLNGLPDALERRCGLTPKQAAEADKAIAEALQSASDALKALSNDRN